MKYILPFLILIVLFSFTVIAHEGHNIEIEGVRYELGNNHKFAYIYQHPNHKFIAQAYPILSYDNIRVHPSSAQSVELFTDSGEVGYLGKINWTRDIKIVSPKYENNYLKSINDFSLGFLLDNNRNLYIGTGLSESDEEFAKSRLGIQLLETNIDDIKTDEEGNFVIISPTKTTVVNATMHGEISDLIYQSKFPIEEKVAQIKKILQLNAVVESIIETPSVSITPIETNIGDQAEEINKLKEDYNKLQLKVEEQDKKLTTFESVLKNITDFLSNIFRFKTS